MLYRLLRATDRTLFTPHVVSLTGLDQIGPRIEDLGIRVTALGVSRANPNPLSIIDVTKAIRAFRPEVIQTWMYHADLLGGIAARLNGGIPVAWGLHHTDHAPGSTSARTRVVIRSCARLSSTLPQRIICCSNATLKVHAERGYDRSRMIVIPNGFDITIFRPEPDARWSVRDELRIPEDAQLVAMLGRYHPQKDHRNFLDAARILAARAPRAHFILCGDGVEWENVELAELVEERGLRDRAHLLGRRDDVPRLLAALDVGSTSASHGEAFPLVIGEAMACGVPCVVTDVGDSALIVGDTGVVVPPRDPEALAAGWLRLLQLDREEHARLGEAARVRIEENFEIGRIAGRFADVHHELVRGREGRRQRGRSPA
jgi:glycosyltransferase involved in cell wall biosynthesis